MQDENTYKLLKLIQQTPQLSQREMAERLGISLGKTNASIKALIKSGLITVQEAVKHAPTIPYLYALTPLGLRELPRLAALFLEQKEQKIRELQAEVKELRKMQNNTDMKGDNR